MKRLGMAGWLFFCLFLMSPCSLYAARAVYLGHESVSLLQSLSPSSSSHLKAMASQTLAFRQMSREVDFMGVSHIALQETWQGVPVLGAVAVVHSKNGAASLVSAGQDSSMNGKIYLDLQKDLAKIPPSALTREQADKALQHAISLYQKKTGAVKNLTQQKSELMIYVSADTADNRAHYIYRVSFLDEADASQPFYWLDAENFELYGKGDEISTLSQVNGGGLGGNIKIGQRSYDGLPDHFASFMLSRNDASNTCYLQNENITVRDYGSKGIMSFICAFPDANHNNLYWNAPFDAVKSVRPRPSVVIADSPANDVYFGALMTKKMYAEWYDASLTIPDLYVHATSKKTVENARSGPTKIEFGQGSADYYPLTTLDVVAHELGHRMIAQYSGLINAGESGALNDAFADMTAQAVETYVYGMGKNSWQIGAGVLRKSGSACGGLPRYMNQPSLDCRGGPQCTNCSIDDYDHYSRGMDEHHASGVYNRFFYLLASTPDWNVEKTYGLMMYANRNHYWTPLIGFNCAARGVVKAAQQLDYDVTAVKQAFDVVKVNYDDKEC